MFKKIALCAMLVLILAPASVMAAGPQGQAPGIGKEAGSCLHVQHQIASDTTAQEKFQNGQGQGSGIASQNGDVQMLRTRSCDQTGEQDHAMVRNMTRDQIRLNSYSGLAGENRGAGSNSGNCSGNCSALQKQGGQADSAQNRFGLTMGNDQNILISSGGQPGFQGRSSGGISPTLLPQSDTTPLTETETGNIVFMREEEQMAHDLYAHWAGMYTIPVFSNIAESETMHLNKVQLLIERYNLQAAPVGNASVGYNNPVIQSLYNSLLKQGDASQNGALEAGLSIEIQDISDLNKAIANTTRADITQVYTNLRQGSENHKSAFLQALGQ
jgi:hypothetical protein